MSIRPTPFQPLEYATPPSVALLLNYHPKLMVPQQSQVGSFLLLSMKLCWGSVVLIPSDCTSKLTIVVSAILYASFWHIDWINCSPLIYFGSMTNHFFGKARVTSAEATCICFGSHRLCHPLVDLKSCCIVNELQVHIFLEAKSNMLPIHSKPRHSTLLRALLWVA